MRDTAQKKSTIPQCEYVFAGTSNRCGTAPTHPVHIYSAWKGPEEYHAFIERPTAVDVGTPEGRAELLDAMGVTPEKGPQNILGDNTAHELLKELWSNLPEDWDDFGGCRWGCSPYSTGKLGRYSHHAKYCIFLRIKEYLDAT